MTKSSQVTHLLRFPDFESFVPPLYKWVLDKNYVGNCFVLNFDWHHPVPLPQIRISLNNFGFPAKLIDESGKVSQKVNGIFASKLKNKQVFFKLLHQLRAGGGCNNKKFHYFLKTFPQLLVTVSWFWLVIRI